MKVDVVIVGGGMVGSALACALGDSPLRVAVLEAAEPPAPAEGFDTRVSAITRATQRVFQGLGAWEGMAARRVAPYREMRVWDATGGGAIHFDSADLGEPDLGHIVENRVIQAALTERLAGFDDVEVLRPVQVAELGVEPGQVRIGLADGRTLTADLVVGADGARSWVREQAGITTTGWSYDQTAVVATVKTSGHHRDTTWQRFMPDGPLAFLPLPEGYSSIVWTTTPERAGVLLSADDGEFLAQLQLAFGDGLGRMEWVGPRGAFPLALQHADAYVAPRLALVGNAAHAIHPLAGQGLNLGVLDAATLAEVLLDARGAGRDIGSLGVLRRYERWRKGENLAVMAAMEGFERLFGSRAAPLRWLRNGGLRLVDRVGPVKHMLMRRAMGLAGDLPRLARHQA